MRCAACFTLDQPDDGPGPTAGDAGPAAGSGGAVKRAAGAAGVAPLPPRIPYAHDPGTYTQWWMAEMAVANTTDMSKECEVYLVAFTGTTVEYPGIDLSLLVAADVLVFVTVILGNQV